MATFVAVQSANEKGLQLNGRSSNLDAQTLPPALNCAKDSASFTVGTKAGSGIVSVASWDNAATKHEMFCGSLFERVLVIPRTKALGFVLSTQAFPVEVWSAFQASAKTLTSINPGGAGVTVSNPYGFPTVFGPGRSGTFTITVSQDGPAILLNDVVFTFSGGVTGADILITGSRLTVFSVQIDWSEGFVEDIAYMTNIIKAYSAMEQRISLRTIPRYSATFVASTLNPKDTAALDALLTSWQARVFGVPWWMDASLLLAGVSGGANTLSVDTTSRPAFEVGGLAMLWTDQHTWEAFTIQTVSSGSVTTTTPLVGTWAAGALVVPLKRGRLSNSVRIKRETSGIASFKPVFDCEVV